MSIYSCITEILYHNDPMNTGCVENTLFYEYAEEAVAINHLLDMDANILEIEVVVKTVFDKFFWENCLSEAETKVIAGEILSVLANE